MAKRNKISWADTVDHPDFARGTATLYLREWDIWLDADSGQLLYQQPCTENLLPLEQALAVDAALKALEPQPYHIRPYHNRG